MSRQKITDNERLNKIFGRFVGMEVSTKTQNLVIGGKARELKSMSEEGKKIYSDIYNTAAKNNISDVRIWTPNVRGGTPDSRPGRLNLNISEDDQGKWFVNDIYHYG